VIVVVVWPRRQSTRPAINADSGKKFRGLRENDLRLVLRGFGVNAANLRRNVMIAARSVSGRAWRRTCPESVAAPWRFLWTQ
jgi:hypothetical protein